MGTRDGNPVSGRPGGDSNATTGTGQGGTQSGSREDAEESILPERESLAQREESSPSLSDAQIGPQTSRTQRHQSFYSIISVDLILTDDHILWMGPSAGYMYLNTLLVSKPIS